MSISNSPLIFIAEFYQHNARTVRKHTRHIKYIATRPGVDRGDGRADLDPEELPAGIHAEYISERPGSDGLFAYRDINSFKPIQDELAEHTGLSWRFVVSLRADDAVNMGYNTREKWEETLRSQMNTIGEKMGIDRSNLRWAAAFHVHPKNINCHVHIVVWEKNQQRFTGELSVKEISEIKRAFANETFREERLKQMQIKTLMRDYIRDHAKGSISNAKELIRELRAAQKHGKLEFKALGLAGHSSLPPELLKEKELAEKLSSLSQQMPGHGRAALKFMPPEIKQEARVIADWMLHQPYFQEQVEKHQKAAEDLASTYAKSPTKLQEARNKAYNDIQDRVAQIIVRAGAEMNRLEKQEKWNTYQRNISVGGMARTCWRAAWQAVERERVQTEAITELEKRKAAAKVAVKQRIERKYGKDYQPRE